MRRQADITAIRHPRESTLLGGSKFTISNAKMCVGYEGTQCEHKKDYCKDDPCINGACIDQEFEYRCECNPGKHVT